MSLFPLNGYCYRRLEKITIWKMQHVNVPGWGNREPTQGIDREVPEALSLVQNCYHWECRNILAFRMLQNRGDRIEDSKKKMESAGKWFLAQQCCSCPTEVNNAIIWVSNSAQALCILTEAELKEKRHVCYKYQYLYFFLCKRWSKHIQFQQKK